MYKQMILNVREKHPLIHCITNYVTANDVANMLLAAGGAPIMGDGIHEVEEITTICQGLVINIGTLKEMTIESMIKAGKKAAELRHPIVFDPVGVGVSAFRKETAKKIINQVPCTVIRGNVSEIKIIAREIGMEEENGEDSQKLSGAQGVDASQEDTVTEENLEQLCGFAKELSRKTGAMIVITGAMDVVANWEQVFIIRNGHPLMTKVTGTGCMLDGVIAAYLCANPDRAQEAVGAAVAAMGLSGELAYEKMRAEGSGTGSFHMHLIDFMSKMDDNQLRGGSKIEIR